MDTAVNAQAHRLLADLAARFDLDVQVITAQFTGGGEGYSITVRVPRGAIPHAYDTRVIDFYNDDTYGPRYGGKAGVRVPAHKVIPYVTRAAENPTEHPSALNHAVLGS